MDIKREVFLDSSFIISCIRKRIDFIFQLEEQGLKPVVPKEVVEEIKDLRDRPGTSHMDREAVSVALEMIEKRGVKKISLGKGKVDEGLIRKGKEGFYVATLDAGIKRNVPKKIVIFSSKGSVGIEQG
jgi:rRNA-processing protein FCF1